MSDIIIYTDGGCRGNQNDINIGGWGAVLEYNGNTKELYEGVRNTTNNKMELTGVIRALEALKTTNLPVRLHADSSYVIDNANKYMEGWKKKGWRKSDGKIVENVELWKRLYDLIKMQDDLELIKVKGHSDNVGNNKADELANKAMDEVE